MQIKGEYIDKMAVRIRELEIEIRDLEQIADKAVEEVKAEYREQINNLFIKKEELNDKVHSLQDATGDAWEDMKAGKDLSWEVFNGAVKKQSEQ